jgi:hypothetical protein
MSPDAYADAAERDAEGLAPEEEYDDLTELLRARLVPLRLPVLGLRRGLGRRVARRCGDRDDPRGVPSGLFARGRDCRGFCGSKKSLANGAPIACLLFGPSPALGMSLLPHLLYHQAQLLACAWLARRCADRPDADEEGPIPLFRGKHHA